MGHVQKRGRNLFYSHHRRTDQCRSTRVRTCRHPTACVAFLNEQLFTTPTWLIDRDLIAKARILPVNAICSLQSNILARLLNKNTFDKMSENEALNGKQAYTASQLFADLHTTIWNNPSRSDIFRRNMQKAYIKDLIGLLDKAQEEAAEKANRRLSYSESPAIARGELIALQRIVKSAAPKRPALPKVITKTCRH